MSRIRRTFLCSLFGILVGLLTIYSSKLSIARTASETLVTAYRELAAQGLTHRSRMDQITAQWKAYDDALANPALTGAQRASLQEAFDQYLRTSASEIGSLVESTQLFGAACSVLSQTLSCSPPPPSPPPPPTVLPSRPPANSKMN